MNDSFRIITGSALSVLRTFPSDSVQCVVTSPPYWGLRDYGVEGQIGLEETPQEFIAKLTEVFEEVLRVLRPDGTLWLNMGDSYARTGGTGGPGRTAIVGNTKGGKQRRNCEPPDGLKSKDLIGQPWRLAFALQAAGWYLRSDIIWHKPNPMPESVTDRPTKSHEYIFLMSKSERYFYDLNASKEPVTGNAHKRGKGVNAKVAGWMNGPGSGAKYADNGVGFGHGFDKKRKPRYKQNPSFSAAVKDLVTRRNKRSVWSIPTQAFKGAHFATFPEALVLPCILAGTKPGDLVLDPFAGAATVGLVALKTGRRFVGIELNPVYVEMAEKRIGNAYGLFI